MYAVPVPLIGRPCILFLCTAVNIMYFWRRWWKWFSSDGRQGLCVSNTLFTASPSSSEYFRIVCSARNVIIRRSCKQERREQHLPQARNAEASRNIMRNAGLHVLSPARCLQEEALLYCQTEPSYHNFTYGVVSCTFLFWRHLLPHSLRSFREEWQHCADKQILKQERFISVT